jgi:2-polyprenyl-6-methoxyphenol hydroxylase-like FAD-dependent oxidoreductase
VSDEPLFLALAESSIEKCGNGEFDARGLANVAWAHAKITINESDTRQALFSFLSKALVAECDKASTATFYATTDYASENKAGMTSRDVANSAWAFAKACHPSASLFTSLCAVSTANDGLERFNNQDLVNTAWAFAKLAVKESVVLMKHARVTITNRAEDNTLTLPNICTLVWAINSCTGGGGGDSADTSTANDFASVSESLASAAERLAYESSPNELAATAWTFADAGEFNTEAHRSLFKTLSKRVSLILLNGAGGDINTSSANSSETSFGDEELDNLEWAFSKAGNPGSVLRVIKKKKKDSTGVLGMAGGKVNSRFDPSSDPSQLKSSSVPGTAKDGKSSLNGDTHGRSSPQDCGTIVVAGGGVGGAAAALALQRNGFTVVVLESDAGFDSRKQGYGLTVQGTDLRDGLGIDLSADDAPSKSHYTFNEHGEILAFYGEAFGKSSGGKQSSTNTPGASSGARFAHVPRQILRLRMLEKVAPGTIKWGCRMSNFEETHIGVKVFLDDGSTIDACLLIGSDGIFSTTRRLLNLNVKGHAQDTLTYCGLCVSLGIVYDAEFKVQLAKERIFETVDGSARVYAMPFTPGSTMWQLSFPCGEEDAKEYSRDTNKLKKKLTELTEKWHDPVPAMLLSTKIENMSGYPVYDRDVLDPTTLRPPDHKKRRVTLMGDAAHPMTPFKAQGANQAVADAVLLARCLTEGVHKFGTIAGVVESLSVFEQVRTCSRLCISPNPGLLVLPIAQSNYSLTLRKTDTFLAHSQKMLQRANRVVKSSREKAREMHSPLALVSNRKSQRDAKGVGAGDMNMVVIRLREQGVNAKHAAAMSKQSESSGYDFDDLVEKVGFHGASLKKIVGVDSAPGDDSKKEKTSKKEKKEKKAKKAKKEKSEKRERDDDSRDKKAKKAKRDK